MPRRAARGSTISNDAAISLSTSTVCRSMGIAPGSRRARSRTSSTIDKMWVAAVAERFAVLRRAVLLDGERHH